MMKYANHETIMLGDIVYWKNSSPLEKGIVVCLIDTGEYINEYDFSYLKDSGGGIMILFQSMSLVQIMRDDENVDIEFVSHWDNSYIDSFLKKVDTTNKKEIK